MIRSLIELLVACHVVGLWLILFDYIADEAKKISKLSNAIGIIVASFYWPILIIEEWYESKSASSR